MPVTEPYVERDSDEIAEEAYRELEAENGGQPTGESESTRKKPDDKEESQPEDKSDEQTQDAEKEDGESEEGNEDKADKKDGEGEDATAENKEGEDEDKQITEYAEKHGMTYAEAKEDIEKTAEIIKQYKNDPAEMARAMRNKDREYHKLRSEVDKSKEKKEPVFRRMNDDQFREWARQEVRKHEKMVEKYREKFPARSEAMSDDAVIEEIVEQELRIYGERASKKEQEIKDTASKKRESLISSIKEADRRFIPEIKAMLQETEDTEVIRDDFDMNDMVFWAKGKRYDADIKEAEERGEKRAKEGAKILGSKPGSGGSKPQSSKSGGVGLTKAQKERALEMFGADYDDEKSYQMFRETYADELKKNANFDPYSD